MTQRVHFILLIRGWGKKSRQAQILDIQKDPQLLSNLYETFENIHLMSDIRMEGQTDMKPEIVIQIGQK